MNEADWLILGIIALSGAISLVRGFVVEAWSLAIWVVAFVGATQGAGPVARTLLVGVELPEARAALAYGGVFVGILILGGLVSTLLRWLIRGTGLTGTDRLLGLGFGLTRGVVLITALVLLAGFTAFPKTEWWRRSQVLPVFVATAERVRPLLPESLRELLAFPVDAAAIPHPETVRERDDTAQALPAALPLHSPPRSSRADLSPGSPTGSR